LLKDWYLSLLHRRLGAQISSGVISNIGNVVLPDELAEHVTDLSFILGPNLSLGKTVSVVGYKGILSLTIGSMIESRELEQIYFATLAEAGLPVSVSELQI
jgi:hypothetical protein